MRTRYVTPCIRLGSSLTPALIRSVLHSYLPSATMTGLAHALTESAVEAVAEMIDEVAVAEILSRPKISFHTLVSAVLTEMEPFAYLGDLVRMMISSRHYFNSEIEHKASLYKHWVTEWDMVLEDRVVERWENETWSDCEDDVKGLPELIACPCSFCCEISKVRKWPSLLYEDLYSVHDIQPP